MEEVSNEQRRALRCLGLQASHIGAETSGGRPTIRRTDRIQKLYELGQEIRPRDGSRDRRVCLAKRLCDGLEVVMKTCLKPKCCNDEPLNDDRAWRRGFELLLELPGHEGLCRTYEVVEDDTAFYVIMERAAGVDLGEYVLSRRGGALDPALCREVLWRLLSATAFLHARSVIHKDLKLENVVVDLPSAAATPAAAEDCDAPVLQALEGTADMASMAPSKLCVKVVDFDTLQAWSHGRPPEAQVVGTDGYAAQEALAGRPSPLSDVFSLGVLAFRLLAGSFPFPSTGFFHAKSGSEKRQMRQRLRASPASFTHATFQEEPEAADLLSRMLEHDEFHRPTAVQALKHPWFRRRGSSPERPLQRRCVGERPHREPGSDLLDRVLRAPARKTQAPRSSSTSALVDKPLPEVGCASLEGLSNRRSLTATTPKKPASQTERLPAFAASRGTLLSGPGGILRRLPPETGRFPKDVSSPGSLSPPSASSLSPPSGSAMLQQAAGELSSPGSPSPAMPHLFRGSAPLGVGPGSRSLGATCLSCPSAAPVQATTSQRRLSCVALRSRLGRGPL